MLTRRQQLNMRGCIMSLEENKAIIRSLYEAFNKRNLFLGYESIASNYFNHTLQLRGLEDFKQFITMLVKSFPDFHMTIENIIAEGDKVWVRTTNTGTHKGEFRGLAPTGNKFTEAAVYISRIVDGKIVEEWYIVDELDFLKQLGVIEYKGFPDEKVT